MKIHGFLFLAVLCFFCSLVSSASVQIDLNGQFYYGGTISISGTVLPAAAHDVNIRIIDANSGTQIDQNVIAADANGVFTISYSNFTASTNGVKRDFNGTVRDINSNAVGKFFFTVANQASLDINFVGNKPPLTVGTDLIVNFSPKNSSGNSVDFNYISLKLLNSSGTVIKDANHYIPKTSDANRTTDYNFGTLTTPGKYTILVDNGVASFNVPVIAYNLFVSSFNSSTGENQKEFSSGSDVNVRVLMSTTTGTALTGTITGTIENPSGTVSTLSFTQIGGYYEDNIPGSVFSSEGTYVVRINANANSYNQKAEQKIVISSYSMNFKPQKNSNAGKKERMKGVYSASSQAILELGITKQSDKSELSGIDLNNACDKNKITLEVFKAGSTIGTNVTFDLNNIPDATCDLNFFTPSSAGDYYYRVTGNDLNVLSSTKDLTASTGLKVQNQAVFFDPVDPSAYLQDPSNSWLFTFYTDQNVGFKVVTIDLNLSINSTVSAVNYAIIRQGTTQIKIPSTNPTTGTVYLDYNVSGQMLTMTGAALTDNNVSAGFVPIEFYVNVNADVDSADANNVAGFGGFKYKKMNLVVEPVDENSTAKSTSFGPPVFNADDENVYLRVTAKTAGNTAIKYASVTLYSLKNVDTWQDVNVSVINAYSDNNGLITSYSSGVARLYLGKLGSGTYFGQIKVQDGNDIDYGDFFIMVKNYLVFAQPMVLEGGQCNFLDAIGTNNDFNMVIMAMLPNGSSGMPGETVDDFNANDVNLYLMSKGEEFKEPTRYTPGGSTTVDINCMGFMGPPNEIKTFKAITLSPPASGWTAGNYRVLVKGNSTTSGVESGDGFFRVQQFKFKLIPVTFGGGGDQKMLQAMPGSTFDINAYSDKNVTLRAMLIDEKTMQDLNSNLTFVGSADVNAGQTRTITIKIPSLSASVPLAEYPIMFTAVDKADADNITEQEIFVSFSLFILSFPSGIQNQALRYQTSSTGAYDTNILDDATTGMLTTWSNHYCNGNVTVGDINYNRWVYNSGTGMNWSGDYDLNHLILVSTTDQNMWIDLDNDCNFKNDASNNKHVGDTNVGILYRSTGPMDGNAMLVYDISSTSLKYLKNPSNLTALSLSRDNFAGQFPVDENIGLPIIIKNSAGSAVQDVNVIVNRVLILSSFGMGMPTEIPSSQWSTIQGRTNSSGYARLVLKLSKPGTYMLELRATSTSGSQVFKPWEGIVLEAQKFTSEFFLMNPTGDITINYDRVLAGSGIFIEDNDVNMDASDEGGGLASTWYDTNYGIFDENVRDFDLDKDGAKDKNFYFIKLTPAFHAANPGQDANVLVDDDKNFCDILYRGQDNNKDNCDGNNNVLEPGLNEAWLDNSWGAFLCPYSQTGQQGADCSNHEAVYAISENDTNATDNNLVLINRTAWRGSGNSWNLYTSSSQDKNIWGWIIMKNLEGVRLGSSGTGNAKIIKTQYAANAGNPGIQIPLTGTYPMTVTGGVGRINMGNLPDSNYMIALDVNILNDLQTQYSPFEVR